ncbi:hypothetical protein EVA_07272 [gut metagenome]|uniref:Uncharacterized protein n=1 Tax=gut metagenome TaxID=749906 RepID=J9GQA4_9ZZZZ
MKPSSCQMSPLPHHNLFSVYRQQPCSPSSGDPLA